MGVMDTYKDASNKIGPTQCVISTVIGSAIPISMLVMGVIHKEDCPAEHYIPIYLIVSGSFAIVLAVFRAIGACCADSDGNPPTCIQGISGLLSLFLFAWFIAGNVWIYRLYNKYSHDPEADNFCDHGFYQYAFWITTVVYIILGASIVLGCCVCICAACCGRN